MGHRVAFGIIIVIMLVLVGPLLSTMEKKELCPTDYSFLSGRCCIDADKNRVCDDAEQTIEEPKVVETPAEQVPNTYFVEMRDLKYSPAELEIYKGDTVIWVNKEEITPHMVYDSFKRFHSPRLEPGQSYNFTFSEIGEYKCRDSIFKQMQGKIIVKEKMPITGYAVLQGIRSTSYVTLILLLLFLTGIAYVYEGKK